MEFEHKPEWYRVNLGIDGTGLQDRRREALKNNYNDVGFTRKDFLELAKFELRTIYRHKLMEKK